MALLHFHSAHLPVAEFTYSAGEARRALEQGCFYCSKKFNPEVAAVLWSGNGAECLYLHATCVSPLFIRLARDVLEWENVFAHGTRRLDQTEMAGCVDLRDGNPVY